MYDVKEAAGDILEAAYKARIALELLNEMLHYYPDAEAGSDEIAASIAGNIARNAMHPADRDTLFEVVAILGSVKWQIAVAQGAIEEAKRG